MSSNNNRAFFKNAEKGRMGLSDIFSDVAKKHSSRETAKVFISGTELTTPSEGQMLAGWQKPFLFARFFLGALAFLLLTWVMAEFLDYYGAYYLLMVAIPFVVPTTLLLLVWEMNIPRNIALYDVLKIVLLGGVLSLIATLVFAKFDQTQGAAWAGLVEEPAKLLVICLVLNKKNYKFSLNGLLVGVAVGTGFAIMESLVYVMNYFFLGAAEGLIEGLVYTGDINTAVDVGLLYGVDTGLGVAISRALTALSGHGIFAGLYGYALVKAKGAQQFEIGHLLKADFLLYFAGSILLHALHNYGIDLGLPVLFDVLPCEYVIIAAIAIVLLMSVLRPAVDQVVQVAKGHNEGRVTMAVQREEAAPQVAPAAAPAGGFQLVCVAGPSVGQCYKLREGQSVTLGRVAGRSDIALPGCENVSSTHCKITVSGGRVTVTDLGSTNGTYLDSQRLAPQQATPVASGVQIILGNKNCAFKVQRI